MELYSGNAAIGYAWLNIKDGQRKMYERLWRREKVKSRPCVEGVGLKEGMDFLRGVWVEELGGLVVTVRRCEGWWMEGPRRMGLKVGVDDRKAKLSFVVEGLGGGKVGRSRGWKPSGGEECEGERGRGESEGTGGDEGSQCCCCGVLDRGLGLGNVQVTWAALFLWYRSHRSSIVDSGLLSRKSWITPFTGMKFLSTVKINDT